MRQLNVRVSDELHRALHDRASQERMFISGLCATMLEQGLGAPLRGSPLERIAEMEEALESLDRRLSALEELAHR